MGGYFIKVLTNYIYEGTHVAFEVIPKNDSYVLPPDYYKHTRPFSAEMNDKIKKDGSLNKALLNKGAIPWDKKATKRNIYIDSKQTPMVEPNFIERIKIHSNSR